MIRKCTQQDLPVIYEIINDAAQAYKGVIPADRWHEPYMSIDELKREIDGGVEFWGYEESGDLMGVMGLQDKGVFISSDMLMFTQAVKTTALEENCFAILNR